MTFVPQKWEGLALLLLYNSAYRYAYPYTQTYTLAWLARWVEPTCSYVSKHMYMTMFCLANLATV